MGDFLNSLTGDQKTKLVIEAAKVVPAIIGFNQANKAKNQQAEYLEDIKTAEKNRQRLVNPYAQLSNPYQNMQVATKAAEMQAEQTDLALANTLDSLRKTGAGGATALAQAALKSKQGIAASIEKQETQNARLAAQGQLQVDIARGRGQAAMMSMQEKREEAQLDRLQGLADLEAMRRQQGLSTGVGSLTSMLSGAADALIKPKATPLTIEEQMAADKGKSISLTPKSGIDTNSKQPSANLTMQKVLVDPLADFEGTETFTSRTPSRSAQQITLPNTTRGLQGIGSEYGGVPMEGQVPFIQPQVNFIPPALQSFTPSNNPFYNPIDQMQGYDLGQTTIDPLTGLTITE